MKLGCCISDREQLALLAAAGGDYCELPLAPFVMAGDEASFEELAGRVSAAIPPLACNVFLPPGLTVVGTRLDADALERYVARAVERARRLGVHVLVFGSGRSRMVPDGFSREIALDQLTRFIDRRDALFCSWGEYDRNKFRRDAKRNGVTLPFGGRHSNLKKSF